MAGPWGEKYTGLDLQGTRAERVASLRRLKGGEAGAAGAVPGQGKASGRSQPEEKLGEFRESLQTQGPLRGHVRKPSHTFGGDRAANFAPALS